MKTSLVWREPQNKKYSCEISVSLSKTLDVFKLKYSEFKVMNGKCVYKIRIFNPEAVYIILNTSHMVTKKIANVLTSEGF